MNAPSISSIIHTSTGENIKTIEFFSEDYVVLMEFRRKCKESNRKHTPLFLCSNCLQPLYIKAKPKKEKEFYFSHLYGSKDCTWKTGEDKDFKKMRYEMFAKVRESLEHKDMKAFINKMLSYDDSFSNICEEKTFHAEDKSSYKRPDVSALFFKSKLESVSLAIEVQLTSTFLDVIIDREIFYYENNANILWIFSSFSKDLSNTRMTEDDILFSNKKNVFVLDEEAKEKSLNEKSLWLKNIHLIPMLEKGVVSYRWSEPLLINIKDITFDEITGKSYIYNFDYYRTRELYKQKMKNTVHEIFVQESIFNPGNYNPPEFISNLLKEYTFAEDEYYIADAIGESYEIIGILYEILNHQDEKAYDKFGNIKPYYSNNFQDEKPNRILRLLNNFINYRPHYTNIIITAIDFYGKREKIMNSDKKKGTFLKKLRSNRRYFEPKIQANTYVALYYLFPELFYLSNIPKESI